MDIPTRFLFAAVPPGADLVQLLVIPASALEPADVVEATLPVVADSQGLEAQIEGHHTTGLFLPFWRLIDKGGVIVAARISGNCHLAKATRRHFGKVGNDSGKAFVLPLAASGQHQLLAVKAHIHGWITEGEELMARAHARKAGLLASRYPPEEGLHGLVQPEVDFRQEFAIDLIDGWIVLPAFGQGLLGCLPIPALARPQLHDQI